jgi:integral membrane sensor domain MASE1
MSDAARAPVTISLVIGSMWRLAKAIVSIDLSTLWGTLRGLWESPKRIALLGAIAGFVLAWVLGRVADSRMTDRFSRFWQEVQQDLRNALKQARTSP